MAPETMKNHAPRLSIVVKALNEERLIDACLRSAVSEAERFNGEVILVDSLSTDRTLQIASGYPIRIVQFESVSDRGCGAAMQLGYQFAEGDFVYLLDGDMALCPGFIEHALRYLEQFPDVAGVGGRLVDQQVNTAADRRRVAQYDSLQHEQDVQDLGGGGLYRRSAIEAVGYLAHRWLPACEESELGARLVSAGWRLVRLPCASVTHTGHKETTWQMLRRLWRNRRMHAYGMFLRSSSGKPWQWRAAKVARHVFVAPALYLLSILAAVVLSGFGVPVSESLLGCGLVIWLGVLALMALKKKDIVEAVYSIIAWHFYTVAALIGFFSPIGDPLAPISSRVIQ